MGPAEFEEALRGVECIVPTTLERAWTERLDTEPTAAEVFEQIRQFGTEPLFDDQESPEALRRLGTMVHTICGQYFRLAQSGKLDAVLPFLNALPCLYSTGEPGAGTWKSMRALFEDKKVGRNAEAMHVKLLGERESEWLRLAEDAARVAKQASWDMPTFEHHRAKAVKCQEFDFREDLFGEFGTLYFIPGGGVFIWPDWLSGCADLPDKISDAPEAYEKACLAIVRQFLGAQGNRFVQPLLEHFADNERSKARYEILRKVAQNLKVLAGSKR